MQWGEVSLVWIEQDNERDRMDLANSNQHNDKGLELSGISLTPDIFFFLNLPCSKSIGVGWVGVFCILGLTLNKITNFIQGYSLVFEQPQNFSDVQWRVPSTRRSK